MKVYVNKETYEICYEYDRIEKIGEMAKEKLNSSEEFDKILSKFSYSFLFNMPESKKAIIRDIFERRCWSQAEQEFNDTWVESELP